MHTVLRNSIRKLALWELFGKNDARLWYTFSLWRSNLFSNLSGLYAYFSLTGTSTPFPVFLFSQMFQKISNELWILRITNQQQKNIKKIKCCSSYVNLGKIGRMTNIQHESKPIFCSNWKKNCKKEQKKSEAMNHLRKTKKWFAWNIERGVIWE